MNIKLENTKQLGLILSITSLILLTIFTPQEKTLKISEIKPQNNGLKGKVYGTIKNLTIKQNNAFFTIETPQGKISAIYFKPTPQQLSLLKENNTIEATAKINTYKQKTQLVIEKIKKIS